MSFINSPRFPEEISYGSSGGPKYKTSVVKISSGFEARNQDWSESRYEYNAAFGVRSLGALDELVSFFHEARGMANTFRYKDYADYTATAESVVSTGATFQLTKTYGSTNPYIRDITKPVSGAFTLYEDGSPLTVTVDYTIDYTSGIVTKVSSMSGAITWTGEFDVPVRFDQDEISVNFSTYQTGTTGVKLVEVKQ